MAETTTLTAKNPTTGDQVTTYVYGTATGGITPEIYRNDVLRAEIYPTAMTPHRLQTEETASTTASSIPTTSKVTG